MKDEGPADLDWDWKPSPATTLGWKPLPAEFRRETLTVDGVLEDLARTGPDKPATDGETDPGDGWWIGGFFPNDCSASSGSFPWREEDEPFAMRVRHLPTEGTLAMVEDVGPGAVPLTQAWRGLWSRIEDVDALHAERTAGWDVGRIEREGRQRISAARALACGSHADAATKALLCTDLASPPPRQVREAALHALEDASIQLALSACGMPFVLNLDMPEGAPRRYAGIDGSLRRLMPESSEYKAADASLRHAYGGPQPYWTSQAFRDRAGRGIAVARGPDWMRVVLADMARQGHERAFVKACASKGGTWTVDLVGLLDGGDALARLSVALGPDIEEVFAHQAMMIQGHVPFLREHRFLVVGHRVVASTASVRSLSILDAVPHRIVHPHAARLAIPAGKPGAYDRGDSVLSDDRALVARMAAGARDLARALRLEGQATDLYCIDMGETAGGRVLPIEINGLASCGIYGACWDRVAQALARSHARKGRTGRASPGPTVRHLETRQFVVHMVEVEPNPVEDVAKQFAMWASARPEAPARLGFLASHADEIRAYVEATFPGQSRKTLRESLSRFDPLKHAPWNERYWDRLLDIGRERAKGFAAELDEVLGRLGPAPRLWHGVNASLWTSMSAGQEGYLGRKFRLTRPGPEDDIVDGEEDGILMEVEATPDSIDRWRTVSDAVISWDARLATLSLRSRSRLCVIAARDHGTGVELAADRSPNATVA